MSLQDKGNVYLNRLFSKTPVTDFDWTGDTDWTDSQDLTSFMVEAIDEASYTPDLPNLMKLDSQLIFVYGTLRQGFYNHKLLRGQEFLGYASTANRFNMFRTADTESPFPVVMLEGRADKVGAIFGEVYAVAPSCLRELDYLESNGTMYKRHLTPVTIARKDGTTKQLHAWMYKGLRNFWSSRQNRLRQVNACIPNANTKVRYYIYTP